jgi:L-rhamnose isomerase/sugar isomerase
MEKLAAFNIAIPSWALGTGGTRFGRFSGGGEPRSPGRKN